MAHPTHKSCSDDDDGESPLIEGLEKKVYTWESAIVSTIGSTIGCIISFRSSAHNGGSTFTQE